MDTRSHSGSPSLRRELPRGIVASWHEADPRVLHLVERAMCNSTWPVLMSGAVGSGKTCAAALVYACWPNAAARWYSMAELTRLIQQCRRDGEVCMPGTERPVKEGNIWSVRIDQPSLLVLDDLGVRTPTESQYEIVYEAINRREGRPLIVTSNHTLDEIAEVYDGRIASRLSAGMEIVFGPADRRPSGERYLLNEGSA